VKPLFFNSSFCHFQLTQFNKVLVFVHFEQLFKPLFECKKENIPQNSISCKTVIVIFEPGLSCLFVPVQGYLQKL
jgi:hypothetical protein